MAHNLTGPKLLTSTNTSVDSASHFSNFTDGGVVAFYFSAHWCPPCRHFTPKLIDVYNQLKAAGKKFEIVFVSSDQDQNAFDKYYGSHPWTAIPYSELGTYGRQLSSKWNIQGIPSLIVVNGNGDLISTNGRADVMTHGANAFDQAWSK